MNQLNDSQADIRADLNFGLFLTKSNHMALSKCLKKCFVSATFLMLLWCFKTFTINYIERGENKNRSIINY